MQVASTGGGDIYLVAENFMSDLDVNLCDWITFQMAKEEG
jgi:hypothetical protein